jgi:aryl-alcohol dehydrogenase-like predicted oxidoreductase
MIAAWGNWGLFQELLRACRAVADRHQGASIANVAVKWVLDQKAVGGVIVGLRAGLSEHTDDNIKSLSLTFTDEDRAQINAVLAKGRDLMEVIGDCGDEYRG